MADERMDVDEQIARLNEALRLQLRSAAQYTLTAGSLSGLEHQAVAERLGRFALEELDDARRLVEKIASLGGEPNADAGPARFLADPGEALEWLIDSEAEALQAASSSAVRATPLWLKAVTGPNRATTRRQARVAGWLAPPLAVQVAPSQRQAAPSMMVRSAGALDASASTALETGASAKAGAATSMVAAISRARMGRTPRMGQGRSSPDDASVSFHTKLSSRVSKRDAQPD